jgi:hypothetical protein
MASINASTSGGGGIITTADASGDLNIQSGGSTVVAVTSTGVAVTGTLAASGAVSGTTGTFTSGVAATSLTNKIQPITASVAASALTITLNPTILDFRASPLTSGTVTTISVPAAISVVIPSTSTMGTVSAVQSRIVVIAINNAGTVELAAVNISGGSVLDETTLITTTAAAAAGNSATAYYSTTARTGVAYRVVGYVESTQATAGTWATAPSTLQGYGGQALAAMSSLGYGQTWQTVTRTSNVTYYNTTGKPIFLTAVSQASAVNVSVTVDGTIRAFSNSSTANVAGSASSIVPPGSSYFCTYTNALVYELR